jgi:hypothetical protein
MTEAGQSPGYFRYAIARLMTDFIFKRIYVKPLMDRLKLQVHDNFGFALPVSFPSWFEGERAGEGLVFCCTSLEVPALTLHCLFS